MRQLFCESWFGLEEIENEQGCKDVADEDGKEDDVMIL